MSRTPGEISQDIRDKLKATGAGLSCELGTPERKIIDAVAESVSECYIDQYIVGSLLDVDAKGGLELEQFVGIFGYGRLQGRRATGEVRLEMNTASPSDLPIPLGTQFYTKDSQPGTGVPLYFASTQALVLPAGSTVALVPVECIKAGSIGNVPSDSVTYMGASIGAAVATNLTPMTGGVDVETDDQLRQRFKDTFLRNVAGTEDFYLSLALQNKHVKRAAVYGPVSTYRTQIAAPASATPISSLIETQDIKYVWPDAESVFKNLGQTTERFYTRNSDYTLGSGASPSFARVGSQIASGEVIDLEFQYTTSASRNNPLDGVTNRVDVFVDGSDPFSVTERTTVTSQQFSTDDTKWNYVGNFARVGDAGAVSATNRFLRLGSVPVSEFPSSFVVDGTTYTRNSSYYLVRSTTTEAGSPREIAGLELTGTGPGTGKGLTLSYTYNRVPEVLQATIRKQKQITTDVQVHQASRLYLRINLTVEYDRGFVVSQVDNGIKERIKGYFDGLRFGDWVEFSDIAMQVHQLQGVDNVWVTLSSDPPSTYGIEMYATSEDANKSVPVQLSGSPKTTDFKLKDNQIAMYLEPRIYRRANR